MDFTKILSAFAAIENKQTLNEAEKKETTWTDMKGNKHPATQVKGDKYTGKEAEKDEKEKSVKESVGYKPVDLAALIARMDTIAESAEKVEEDDVEEGNEFSGELAKAKAAGKKEFEVDGKKYDVKEGKKPDFLDMDKDGDKKEPMKKALKDKKEVKEADDRPDSKEKETTWTDKEGKKHPAKQVQGWQSVKADKEADKEKKETMKESQLDECGDMMGGMVGEESSGMNVNTSIDTRTGRKTVSISADGESADELMQVLKLAGIAGMGGEEQHAEPEMAGGDEGGAVEVELVPLAHAEGGFKMGGEEEGEKEVEETYANEPAPEVQPVDAQLHQGTDLNREKAMTKHGYKQGDNPLAMREARELADLEAQLMEELESIKVKAY
jgi:hypothetical protein